MTAARLEKPEEYKLVKRTVSILNWHDVGLKKMVGLRGGSQDAIVREALDYWLRLYSPDIETRKNPPEIEIVEGSLIKKETPSSARSSAKEHLCPTCRKVFTGEECPRCRKGEKK